MAVGGLILLGLLFKDFLWYELWLIYSLLIISLIVIFLVQVFYAVKNRDVKALKIIVVCVILSSISEISRLEYWKSEIVLEAYKRGDVAGERLILRENGEYTLQGISLMGELKPYHGNYNYSSGLLILNGASEYASWICDY